MIRVGMSGFSYPEWIGEIYPEGTKRTAMLAEYANIFPAVEINMSFRQTPKPTTTAKWHAAVPESFQFVMKANAGITHYRRLAGPKEEIDEFLTACAGLHAKLGPVLFQIPKTVKFDQELIDGFGCKLPPGGLYTLEPRDESWLTPEAIDALRRHNIALCLNDDHFEPDRYEQTGRFVYFRFHKDIYVPGDLEARAEIVRNYASKGTDVYAIFQHEDNPESVKPALRFLELTS